MEKRLLVFLACLFLNLGMALAQIRVSGTVTSSDDGEPVVGASILVQGTKTGTVTVIAEADGKLYSVSKLVKVTIGGCGG